MSTDSCQYGWIDGHCASAPTPPTKGNTTTNGSGNTSADNATSAGDTGGNDKGSSSPESPQPPQLSREQQVQALIDAQKYDDAIALAIKLYGIKLRLPNRFIQFNDKLDVVAYTDLNGNIYVGIDAMSSPGWLASSIGHENVHVEQLVEDAWYFADDGANLNEVEAYDWELRNADANGLTQSEQTDLAETRYSYLYSIRDLGLQIDAQLGHYRPLGLYAYTYSMYPHP